MSSFSKKVADRIHEKGLSVLDAAAAVGVNIAGLRGVLSGKSIPNARSFSKYSGFLGLSDEQLKELIAADPRPGKAGRKSQADSAKEAGKPGRKPGKPSRKATKLLKGKPGRTGRTGRGAPGSLGDALSVIGARIKQAETLMADPLAVQVHGLNHGTRKLIEGVIKSLG